VVHVLLAPTVIQPGRQDVAIWVRTDPDLLPRRRNSQLPDAVLDRSIDCRSLAVLVAEALAAPLTANAWLIHRDVDQTSNLGAAPRILVQLDQFRDTQLVHISSCTTAVVAGASEVTTPFSIPGRCGLAGCGDNQPDGSGRPGEPRPETD